MQVFITGGTGLIGSRLVRRLLARGDRPVVLTRREFAAEQMFDKQVRIIEGDPTRAGPWQDAAAECDAAVNLAGENLFKHRWNDAFKALIRDSRIQGTRNVVAALARKPRAVDGRPKTLVNASAIGYYGPHGDEQMTEDSQPGSDFLAEVCVKWEHAAREAEGAGLRCALVRIGVVLDRKGGALAQLWTPFRMGIGGPIGDGKQWMSWIHHEDIAGVMLFALDNAEVAGPVNGTAPNPVTNREFSTVLGRALHRPSFLPMPRLALRAMLGEAADVVAAGQRVLPKRTLALGYAFKYPQLDAALAEIAAS